jgi:hypothetical protein
MQLGPVIATWNEPHVANPVVVILYTLKDFVKSHETKELHDYTTVANILIPELRKQCKRLKRIFVLTWHSSPEVLPR